MSLLLPLTLIQVSTDDAWSTLMSMQAIAPGRAQARAQEPTFDSIFRPKRQAYPAHCNCQPTPPTCANGPPGPPGEPGHDGRTINIF